MWQLPDVPKKLCVQYDKDSKQRHGMTDIQKNKQLRRLKENLRGRISVINNKEHVIRE